MQPTSVTVLADHAIRARDLDEAKAAEAKHLPKRHRKSDRAKSNTQKPKQSWKFNWQRLRRLSVRCAAGVDVIARDAMQ